MEKIRVSIINKDNFHYDSFVILDNESFFRNLKDDPLIAEKYKKMNIKSFLKWIDEGITPKQYRKLQDLNCF